MKNLMCFIGHLLTYISVFVKSWDGLTAVLKLKTQMINIKLRRHDIKLYILYISYNNIKQSQNNLAKSVLQWN